MYRPSFLEYLFLPCPAELTSTDEPSTIQLPDGLAEMYTPSHRGPSQEAVKNLLKTQFL